jgi:hypothetical protein
MLTKFIVILFMSFAIIIVGDKRERSRSGSGSAMFYLDRFISPKLCRYSLSRGENILI